MHLENSSIGKNNLPQALCRAEEEKKAILTQIGQVIRFYTKNYYITCELFPLQAVVKLKVVQKQAGEVPKSYSTN